ncbi:CmpA/NrtA family ABC transporter substrate-binding protein [Paracraurococcus lichenis]|uniref:CmpA/NrtA family ABC transporter substrate-binding protein n=1 Tax=Paracraurococcus lichenis TaxID=3064888 RepID=A0ABT9DV88_9PROT|nr:CmpA/NrtA family ABC transporter substrate-binding protein [Paracraurococcus sp. LOR1-02]MDO9707813.1 CmpA/NrtA family ABC transporter substrate-binding protein [Paracraurococcus sp. LOR1-02]
MTTSLTRRRAIAASAALLAAARAATPRGAFAQGSTATEVKKAVLGYIALTDSAPLIIAREKGLFAKYGLPEVEVSKQASWGATRDNLVLGGERGGIDGAHILTPLPYLMTAGRVTQNNQPVPMVITARLNTNGQALSVAEKHKALKPTIDASGLKRALNAESKVAMTFRGGTHDLWIRYWLAAAGIDPDKDVQTIVVPPPQMVANMKVGTMDAFCVGEPWNDQLVNQKIGFSAAVTGELWQDHPEKSLGLRADWVEKNPNAAVALTAAVIEAARWCDEPANKQEMCSIIGKRAWFNVPVADILQRSLGNIDYGDGRKVEGSPLLMKFFRDHASYPFQSHELWFLTEDIRWGVLPEGTDTKALIAQVNREQVWRQAAERAGVKPGETPSGTSRGRETFFDGKVFDPEDPAAYLASLAIKKTAGA